MKVKSTPRFHLVWEFDKNLACWILEKLLGRLRNREKMEDLRRMVMIRLVVFWSWRGQDTDSRKKLGFCFKTSVVLEAAKQY